jgi:histidine triad (HIT) family protein
MPEDCLFCKIVDKKIDAAVVYEDDWVVAFEDIQPQAPTHTLIIPRLHIEKVRAVGEKEKLVAGHIVHVAGEIARKKGLEYFRLVANDGAEAGQSVFHLHFHLLGGRPLSWPPG